MKMLRTIMFREAMALLSSRVVHIASALFLAAAAALFSYALTSQDAASPSVTATWSLSVSMVLPFFVSVLAMNTLSARRGDARLDLLLVTPASESDIVLGKTLGVFAVASLFILLSMVVPEYILSHYLKAQVSVACEFSAVLSLTILLLQAFVCSAVGVFASSLMSEPMLAAVTSFALLVGIPEGIFRSCLAWWPAFREHISALPFKSHVLSVSNGSFSSEMLVFYIVLIALPVFLAVLQLRIRRLRGAAARSLRNGNRITIWLSVIAASLALLLSLRYSVSFRFFGNDASMFDRAKMAFAEIGGDVRAICFVDRNDVLFKRALSLADNLKNAAKSVGVELDVVNVDPRWDVGESSRLVTDGIMENSIVFESNHRRTFVPIDGCDDAVCTSALLRLVAPRNRNVVYFATGHGEADPLSYDSVSGMSDFARMISRNGYEIRKFSLTDAGSLPNDCAAFVMTQSPTAYSQTELLHLDEYASNGGRILMFVNRDGVEAFSQTLKAWGIALDGVKRTPMKAKTINGVDMIGTASSDQVIVRSLKNVQFLFRSDAVGFVSDASAQGAIFSPLVGIETKEGPMTAAVAVERGPQMASLAVRPSRLVAIGDTSMPLNMAMSSRGNANSLLLANALSWLAGYEVISGDGSEADALVVGMTKNRKSKFTVASAAVFPLVVLLVLTFARRRR